MVNTIVAYKALLHKFMKSLAGVRPRKVEIEPGTVMNFWVPKDNSTKKTKNHNEVQHKPVVVLLHGFGGDGIFNWQFQVRSLTSKYAVYIPDFIFFGGSFTDSASRSPEFQAECVAKGLWMLGVERCTIVGHSYGGMVGFKMAEKYPDFVESMVVSCSVLALTDSVTAGCLERIGLSCWSDYLLPNSIKAMKVSFLIGTYKLPWLPNFLYKDFLEAMSNNRKEKEELIEALLVRDHDFTIPNYPQKIHLLWGENDTIFNMEIAQNLKKQLGDKATLQCISGAGHLAPLERPCIYNRNLKKILASLETDGRQE